MMRLIRPPKISEDFVFVIDANVGFFAHFNAVLGALHKQTRSHSRAVVSLRGTQYGTGNGDWWKDYFVWENPSDAPDPYTLSLGELRNQTMRFFNMGTTFAPSDAKKLIDDFIVVRPEILKKVDDFYDQHFKGRHFVAVHYRGTDKVTEGGKLFKATDVAEHLNAQMRPDSLIFVASDTRQFVDDMHRLYGERCVSRPAPRSVDENPVHLNRSFPSYEKGESALIDCLLLSKSDYLFRTVSNLSTVAQFFSPNLPCTNLTNLIG